VGAGEQGEWREENPWRRKGIGRMGIGRANREASEKGEGTRGWRREQGLRRDKEEGKKTNSGSLPSNSWKTLQPAQYSCTRPHQSSLL
jgi:hypothetical protein